MSLYDIHPDINPFTKTQALKLLKNTEVNDVDTCNWALDICREPAVRLAIFTCDGKKFTLKYLCERHKIMGMN